MIFRKTPGGFRGRSQGMFSTVASRLHGETNPLYKLRDEIARAGHPILDLTSGNVTEQGILFPGLLLEQILRDSARGSAIYRPDSFGQKSAREAVASYYLKQGVFFPPEQILLTPGTSLSYWYAFKLLANQGDEILCPRPSYPLFDYIAALSGVSLIPYPLDEAKNWAIDLEKLEHSISTRTRALAVISPHNPTGHAATADELESLAELARRHDLAIIFDEVFCEFLLQPGILPRPGGATAPLILTLNGFAKMFALPGMKFGWMAVSGDSGRVRQAMRALELISDTFLPVNEIVQSAAPQIFNLGQDFLAAYRAEVGRRWGIAREYLDRSSRCRYSLPAGGFYVTLRIPHDEEATAEGILRSTRTLVHPGHFYDIEPDHLVLSFVATPDSLHAALPGLLEHL